MIIKRGAKTSVLWLWIISYIIVLCFPLAFSQMLYSASSAIIADNIRALDEAALMRTQESVDRVLIEIRSLGRELLMNNQVYSLLYAQKPLSATKLEKAGQLLRDLQAKTSHHVYIDDIYVYFDNPQIVVSTKEYYGNIDGFERTLQSTYGLDFTSFLQLIAGTGDFQAYLFADGTRADKLIVLMTSSYAGNHPEVACLFSLRTDRFRQILSGQAHQPDSSYLWMVSGDGAVLAAEPEMRLSDGDVFTPQALQAAYQAGTLDRRLVVTEVTGSFPGWTLYSAVSAEQSSASLRQVQRMYLLYFALCLGIGLAMSVVFARTSYRPIRRIGQMLRIDSGGHADGEFSALETALVALIEREQESASQLRQQQQLLRQSALTRMLLGRVDTPQLFETLCADNGLHFTGHRFLFVGIFVRESGDFIVPENAGKQDEGEWDDALLGFVVSSVIEELLQPVADAYAFEWDEQVYCLVAPRNGETSVAFENAICDVCARAEQFIHARTAIRATYYVSNLYDGGGDPIASLREAAACVQWGMRQIEGFQLTDTVLTRSQLAEKNSALHDAADAQQTRERRAHYIRAVLAGNLTQADTLLSQARLGSPFPPECAFANVQFSAAMLFSDLVESALTPVQIDRHKVALTTLLASIRQARDAEELEATLRAAALDVREMASDGETPDAEDAMYLAVQAYVADNYRQPNLSVASICDHFSVSSSYLLKLFKRYGQSGVLGCVQQVRINAAKELLRGTRMTVAQIAEQVGYANALTLIRAFKRTEGVTPTSYRTIVNP